jgi:NIPSNAP
VITSCRIVELRRYALHPGARDTLIELFDRELVESQEAGGMDVLGQFRDLDDPDSFVWLRAFSDMRTRKRALEAFYGGPVWKAHARAANATMVAVDNVLLLRRLSGLALDADDRPAPGSTTAQAGLLAVTIYPLADSVSSEFPAFFARELEPALHEAGITVLGSLVTEHSPNTYPALPVREHEDVFVWMALFADEDDQERHIAELEEPVLARYVDRPVERLRLTPTARSLIHA